MAVRVVVTVTLIRLALPKGEDDGNFKILCGPVSLPAAASLAAAALHGEGLGRRALQVDPLLAVVGAGVLQEGQLGQRAGSRAVAVAEERAWELGCEGTHLKALQ